ncbi:MAG TPA: ATP-binding protein [Terriglobales bacterium]|nr:ATP-binding protein [Terriglobales bacterium]
MSESLCIEYEISGDDFTTAGEASSDVKRMLRQVGMSPDFVRRVSVAMYEGEINIVIHAHGGKAAVTVEPTHVKVVLTDSGPGIPDVELAMKEGYTTAPDSVRSLGFGAGMGLPNMKRYSDSLLIESTVGVGTTVTMDFYT